MEYLHVQPFRLSLSFLHQMFETIITLPQWSFYVTTIVPNFSDDNCISVMKEQYIEPIFLYVGCFCTVSFYVDHEERL